MGIFLLTRTGHLLDSLAGSTAPNKHRPARRRLITSSPAKPLRSSSQACQPENARHCLPATPRLSGVKTPNNSYKYLLKGAPHLVPPLGPQNANEAPHPHCTGITLPLRTTAVGATLKLGHPLANCIDPPLNQRRKSAT
jgi:hypothetical protein